MLYGKKQNATDKFFIVPNVVFHLGLSSGEIVVYSYLMCCEDRKTFQCYPSYKTIGSAVGMSVNTVRKYVQSLEKKRLISTEWTMVNTRDGRAQNGNMKYTIRPIQEAIDYYDEMQMKRLYAEAERKIWQISFEDFVELIFVSVLLGDAIVNIQFEQTYLKGAC